MTPTPKPPSDRQQIVAVRLVQRAVVNRVNLGMVALAQGHNAVMALGQPADVVR
jgi:hypothetical protein